MSSKKILRTDVVRDDEIETVVDMPSVIRVAEEIERATREHESLPELPRPIREAMVMELCRNDQSEMLTLFRSHPSYLSVRFLGRIRADRAAARDDAKPAHAATATTRAPTVAERKLVEKQAAKHMAERATSQWYTQEFPSDEINNTPSPPTKPATGRAAEKAARQAMAERQRVAFAKTSKKVTDE